MNKPIYRLALRITGLLLLAGQTPGYADTHALPSPLRLSGFATLGYSYSSDSDLTFKRDFAQSFDNPSAGSWRPDSLIGLQVDYRFNPELATAVQAVIQDERGDSYDAGIDWAYLSYHPYPNLNLRAGRIGVDAYMSTDYRNVGYARTAVRQPREIYGFPFNKLDGLDVLYTLNSGITQWHFKFQYGQLKVDAPFMGSEYRFETDNLINVYVEQSTPALRLRAGILSLELKHDLPLDTTPLQQLSALNLPGISQEAAYLQEQFKLDGTRMEYVYAGLFYKKAPWVVDVEVANARINSNVIPNGKAGYAQLGYIVGNYTPYIGVARFIPGKEIAKPQSNWSPLGPDSEALQTLVYSGINSTRIDQASVWAGVRWDIGSDLALKMQWNRTFIEPYGYGQWQLEGTPDIKRTTDLYSMSLDWTF